MRWNQHGVIRNILGFGDTKGMRMSACWEMQELMTSEQPAAQYAVLHAVPSPKQKAMLTTPDLEL